MINYSIWCFLSFFHFLHSNVQNNRCHNRSTCACNPTYQTDKTDVQMYSWHTYVKWLEQSNIFTSTWFSSAQNLFIQKFQQDFCNKIQSLYNFGKVQSVGGRVLSEDKKLCFLTERFCISSFQVCIFFC